MSTRGSDKRSAVGVFVTAATSLQARGNARRAGSRSVFRISCERTARRNDWCATLDAGGGVCGHRDLDAGHRGGEHGAAVDRRGVCTPTSAGCSGWWMRTRSSLAAVVLTAGSLADRFGRRRVFCAGLVVFTVASAVCAAAGSIELLVAARAVQGLGAALLFATSLALLADAFPDARDRTRALAAYGATIGASFAVGPAVGGALDQRAGLALGVPRQRADRDRRALDDAACGAGIARSARAPGRRSRAGDAHRRPVPARPRAAARQRGRLGKRGRRGCAGRRGGAARGVRRRAGALVASDAAAWRCCARARSPARS